MSSEEVDPAFLAAFVAYLVPFIAANSEEPFPTLDVIGYVRAWLDQIEDRLVLKASIEDAGWRQIADAIDRSTQVARETKRDTGADPEDKTWTELKRLAS
jgi:hypothetical protein